MNINMSIRNGAFFCTGIPFLKQSFASFQKSFNLNTLESPKSAIFKSDKLSPQRIFSGFKIADFGLSKVFKWSERLF